MTKFNAAFWKWFGDSQVVDSKGNPLVVYHGATDYFRVFRKINEKHYFCTNKDYAWCMAKERSGDRVVVVEAYLASENPIDLRELGSRVEFTATEIKSELKRLGVTKDFTLRGGGDPTSAWWQWFNNEKVYKAIIASGYDGVVMREEASGCSKYNDENNIWVVFEPDQIKAIDNDGSWDADDPDIRSNPDEYWGSAGAGILFTCEADGTIMLALRSYEVEQPGTWGTTGGSCSGEEFHDKRGKAGQTYEEAELWDCALRETREELGYIPSNLQPADKVVYRDGSFSYTTFVVDLSVKQKHTLMDKADLNWENDEIRWFDADKVQQIDDLHFGAAYVLKKLS